MNRSFYLTVAAAVLAANTCLTSCAIAQHNDVEFGYDDHVTPTTFLIDPLAFDFRTLDDIILINSSMEELDPFDPGEFAADQPGFTTNPNAGLFVNPGDSILINVLDATVDSDFGVGYVNYYNPLTDSLQATGRIAFQDNTSSTEDLVLNGDMIESGDSPQFIRVADSGGDVHDHIVWDLLDDDTAPLGAYGILVEMNSDFAPNDGTVDLKSERFWIVFNHGMSQEDLENLALPKFGVVSAVPANNLTVFRGNVVSGGLSETTMSDDQRLLMNPGFTINSAEAPVWLIFDSVLGSDSPGSLDISYEASAGTPGLTGTVEAFNWSTSSYEIVGESDAQFNSDVVVSTSLAPASHVESGTAAVRTRIGWRQTGFTINFPWEVRVDHVIWLE